MARVRDMQGVSAHLETLKSKDGKRRNPAKCIFHEGIGKARVCKNERSPLFTLGCHSSKNCDFYSEEE